MRAAPALLVLCLLGNAGCTASPAWDPTAAESLKQEAVAMLGKLDAGDYVGMLSGADSNLVILDFDANNTPIRTDDIAASREFMTRMTDLGQSQGMKFSSTVTRNDAWATSTMGYAVVEYDQTITAGGQTMGPFKYRGTLVARREGGAWRMVHWHGSFRELPPQSSPAGTTGSTEVHDG